MKTLEEVLDTITYESADDCPCDNKFAEIIQKQMPEYDVEVFDEDDDGYTCPGDTIAATVKDKFVEDMQTQEWCTDEQDVYYYIVAIKTK